MSDRSSWLHACSVTGRSGPLSACRSCAVKRWWGRAARERGGRGALRFLVSSATKVLSLPSECARVFHAAGAKLVLCGRNREALEELSRELAAAQAAKVSPWVLSVGKG